MHGLSASQLLDVWEQGRAALPGERALLLLHASAAAGPREPEALTVGRRDAALLQLRALTFGRELTALATCTACTAQIEFDMTVDDLMVDAPTTAEEHILDAGEYHIRFRLPTGGDLAALSRGTDALASLRLLERCIIEARRGDVACGVASLPQPAVEMLEEQMLRSDPQAEVHLNLTCDACGHQWQAPFDVVSYFWSEIDARAKGLLREVHTLARIYGWGETEILALSPFRRRSYMEMAAP